MPGSLTHIRIAFELLPVVAPESVYAFIAGNLAPDAGLLLPDKTYVPPKTVTHFKMPGQRPFALADRVFYERHIMQRAAAPAPPEASFLQGYFCHLLTDNWWAYRTGKRLVRGQFVPVDAQFRAAHPAFNLPPAEPLAIPADIGQFLPRALIEQKIADITAGLMLPVPQDIPPAPPDDIQRVNAFIAELPEVVRRVFQRLQSGSDVAGDAISTLVEQ